MKVWIIWLLAVASVGAQDLKTPSPLDGLVFEVTIGSRFRIGEPIPIRLTLANPTSKPVELFSLEAADVNYTAKQGTSVVSGRTSQGPVVTHIGNLYLTEADRRKRITLAPGQQLERELELVQVFGRPPWDGQFQLHVEYWDSEGKLDAEAKTFFVYYDADRSVARLLELMDDAPTNLLTADASAVERNRLEYAISASYYLHAKFYPLISEELSKLMQVPLGGAPKERFAAAARGFRDWYLANQSSLSIPEEGYAVRNF